jgi:hypothetical protein
MFTEPPPVLSGINISEVVKVRMYEDCQGAVHSNMGCLTGIPAHIAILNKMQKLEKLVGDGCGGLGEKLEEMGLGSEAYKASALLESIRDVKKDLQEAVDKMNSGDVAQARINEMPIEEECGKGRQTRLERRTTYCWGGQFRALPQNFVLPISMDMCTVICYWYIGSKQLLVPPLKFAKAIDFPPAQDVKKMRSTMCMMKKLISGVERAAYEACFGGDDGCVIKTAQEATALFMAIEKYFPNGSKGHKHGVAWKTI